MNALLSRSLRAVLSFFFILSGMIKFLDPARFYLDVKAFEIVPPGAAYILALFLPVFELVTAFSLWVPSLRRGAAALLGLSTLAFIAVLALSGHRGLDLDCGCFGDWLVFPSLGFHIAFNAALFAGSLYLVTDNRSWRKQD